MPIKVATQVALKMETQHPRRPEDLWMPDWSDLFGNFRKPTASDRKPRAKAVSKPWKPRQCRSLHLPTRHDKRPCALKPLWIDTQLIMSIAFLTPCAIPSLGNMDYLIPLSPASNVSDVCAFHPVLANYKYIILLQPYAPRS